MERLTLTALTSMGPQDHALTEIIASEDAKKDPVGSIPSSFPFNKLPLEIRLLVWEAALVQESSERIVILTTSRFDIIPSKSLVSPMLSASRESRSCALKFFDLKLPLFDVSVSLPNYREVDYPGVPKIVINPEDDKCVYISLAHDIFTSGLDLQPWHGNSSNRKDNKWALVPTILIHQYAHAKKYAPVLHREEGIFHVPAKYRTPTIWGIHSPIRKVLVPCADMFYGFDSKLCPCHTQHYNEHFNILCWPRELFPGIQQQLIMYPWRRNTDSKVAQLSEYLFKRQPGESLPDQCKPGELVWPECDGSNCTNVLYRTPKPEDLMDSVTEETQLPRRF